MVEMEPNSPDEKPTQSPGTPAAGPGGDGGERGSPAASASGGEIAGLQAELAEAKSSALRAWAELENYRKRANRQIEDERRYASLSLMRDLLPVLDNVKRAIEAAETTHDTASLLEGIKMVVQQIESVLGSHHCKPIPALHQPFDPNVHNAVLHQPSAEFPPNTVIHEIHQGFQLHDRVVRPSHVIVASPAEPKAGATTGEDERVA